MPYVSDLLRITELGMVLIQSGGPERDISWVASGTPAEILPVVNDDAFVVVSALTATSDETWHDLISKLSRTRIVGLGYHLERHESTPPALLIQTASAYRLALVSVPATTPIAEISKRIAQLRHGDELRQVRESLLAQRRVLDLAFDGSGPAGIVSAVASLTGRQVAIVEGDGEAVAATAGFQHGIGLTPSPQPAQQPQRLSIGGGRELIAQGEPLTPEGVAAFTAAAIVLSVEERSLSHNTVLERERWGRVTRAIVTGEGDAVALCSLLDPDQHLPLYARVIVIQGQAEAIAKWRAEHRSGMQRFITRYPIDDHRPSVVAPGIGVAWQVTCEAELDRAISSITSHGLDAAVGVQTPLNQSPMSRLTAEALLSRLSQTEQLYQAPRIPTVLRAEAHSEMLSLMLTQPETLSFSAMVLGPLSLSHSKCDQELRETLYIFLGHHGQRSIVAELLGIHRNTLRGRLNRIEDLVERSLDSPDDRAELWLALKAEVGKPTLKLPAIQ